MDPRTGAGEVWYLVDLLRPRSWWGIGFEELSSLQGSRYAGGKEAGRFCLCLREAFSTSFSPQSACGDRDCSCHHRVQPGVPLKGQLVALINHSHVPLSLRVPWAQNLAVQTWGWTSALLHLQPCKSKGLLSWQ